MARIVEGVTGWRARAVRAGDGLQARLSARTRVLPGELVLPEPRLAGSPAAGRRLLEGQVRLGAEVASLDGRSIWDLGGGTAEAQALHGCLWLDDLAALGGTPARLLAQGWAFEWIERFGGGTGPGWTPGLAASRLLRWTGHAGFLLKGRGAADRARLADALARQALFLSRRLRAVPSGARRVEALAALVQVGLALPSRRGFAAEAARSLAGEAARVVDREGATASRSPKELLEVAALLAGAERAMAAAGLAAEACRAAAEAVARAAPTLRALRHGDGGLARFHGGDRGGEGQLDGLLAQAGRPRAGPPLRAMGFARLQAGRVSVIADAGLPPWGPASTEAHASALAIEVTSGRHPVVVSCGPGRGFGAEWRRAGRATPSHSTLTLDHLSSSRIAPPRRGEEGGRLADGPSRVVFEPGAGLRVEMAHDGWRRTHGLTHARTLDLAPDGGWLAGEDLLTTLTAADARALDQAVDRSEGLGLAAHVRFHLHPDVEAYAAEGGRVDLLLPGGERWTLAQEGAAETAIEPSAYLEEGAEAPRLSAQVVLVARVLGPSTRLRWTLTRTLGTPRGLRIPSRDEEER